jgi:alpha-amylase/alpha-mannosidase (GH57 family)
MTRDLILHGHFYQPPREDPWMGEVPEEPSAAPFHDWNERILSECYRANAFARVFENDRILGIGNNYELLSFNFGPTLLNWLERHDPVTLERIVAADRHAVATRGGHGNAIAQAYHHPILPLADPLDRATEIRWGQAEFRHRFGRDAEAMWLPECAADNATLGALVDQGLAFAVLAPMQAGRVRPPGGKWRAARDGEGFDPGRAYRWQLPDGSGRTLALFFYDGIPAHAIAFDGALGESRKLVEELEQAAGSRRRLVHAAVDGETFGHHQRFGERVAQHVLGTEAPAHGFRVTNYGQHLAENPPSWEVELDLGADGLGSSWSCAHGVGRWRRDCGCRLVATTAQAWRGPLRMAFDLLRERGREFFVSAAEPLFADPWAARDGFVAVRLEPTAAARARFLARHARADLLPRERTRALLLMEMQCDLLAMYTSCGWFFDDIAGIESRIVLRRAARALARWRELGGDPPWPEVLAVLGEAKSNDPSVGTGAHLLRGLASRELVAPAWIRPLGAPLAVGEITDAATAELLLVLRRWVRAGEHDAERFGADVLRALQATATAPHVADYERAQEVYAVAVLESGTPRPLAREIGMGLGFSAQLLARRLGSAARPMLVTAS